MSKVRYSNRFPRLTVNRIVAHNGYAIAKNAAGLYVVGLFADVKAIGSKATLETRGVDVFRSRAKAVRAFHLDSGQTQGDFSSPHGNDL